MTGLRKLRAAFADQAETIVTASTYFDEAIPLTRAADALAAPVEDRLLLLSVEQGSYFDFSPVTRRIWELLEEPRSLSELVASLVSEYEVDPETCRTEVRAVVKRLVVEGLLVIG